LFGGQDPLGEKIRVDKLSREVIGVLQEKGQSSIMDQDDVAVIPADKFPHHKIVLKNP
jgi:putative ABC transport system permease protein